MLHMNWLALKITPMKWVLLILFLTSLWVTYSRESADDYRDDEYFLLKINAAFLRNLR